MHVGLARIVGMGIVALVGGATNSPAQVNGATANTQAITGLIFDRQTNAPIADARVTLTSREDSAGGYTVVTDSVGSYMLANIPFGQYALAIGRFGFADVVLEITVDRVEQLSVSIGLNPVPLALPPVVVETEADVMRARVLNAAPSVSSRRNTIDVQEIEQRNLGHQTAFAIIRRLRPGWLTTRGDVGTAGITGNNRIVLYVDGVRRGVVDDSQSIGGTQ